MYAFLSEVPGDHTDQFFYASREPIVAHATKLNLLADRACAAAANDDDVLVFIDGDAFPIAPLEPLIEARLAKHRLIAVQRYENNGDVQPHPCFCVTTVGFWKAIRGDWNKGSTWRDLDGNEVTDVGGNLLALLEAADVNWHRLKRVNRLNPHPVLFAIYGDEGVPVVYHHGAGFREGGVRIDDVLALREAALTPDTPAAQLRAQAHARAAWLKREWVARIMNDPDAWRSLMQEPDGPAGSA